MIQVWAETAADVRGMRIDLLRSWAEVATDTDMSNKKLMREGQEGDFGFRVNLG